MNIMDKRFVIQYLNNILYSLDDDHDDHQKSAGLVMIDNDQHNRSVNNNINPLMISNHINNNQQTNYFHQSVI